MDLPAMVKIYVSLPGDKCLQTTLAPDTDIIFLDIHPIFLYHLPQESS
jgi:hypothetical protein